MEGGWGIHLVYRNDKLGIFHSRQVLYRTRDADRNVKLGSHYLAGLSNLQ